MARPKNFSPTYRKHRNSARCLVNGRWIELGRFNSPESRAEFARIVAELAASPATAIAPSNSPTVVQIIAAFWRHAEEHYRHPDGTQTGELSGFRDSLRPLRKLYGHTPACNFGPLALKTVRQSMIDDGLTRKLINQRIGRIKRVFRWAASEELVPVEVHTALTTVAGLQAGRSKAREAEPVLPVAEELVEATLPFLNRHVRGLVQFQRLTGCRPGEACRLRRADIDMTGNAWSYRPARHKTAHRAKCRNIAVGPRAQSMLREFLDVPPTEYLFSPKRAMAEFRASQRARRKTPVQVSQQARQPKSMPKRQPGARYTTRSYFRAVAIACERGFPLPLHLARHDKESREEWEARLTPEQRAEAEAWRKKHHWCPLQLRHTFATTTRKLFNLEHAGAALGHSKMSATEVYAERDAGLALEVAARIG